MKLGLDDRKTSGSGGGSKTPTNPVQEDCSCGIAAILESRTQKTGNHPNRKTSGTVAMGMIRII